MSERIDNSFEAPESIVAPEHKESTQRPSLKDRFNSVRNTIGAMVGFAVLSGAPVDVDFSHTVEAAEQTSVKAELREERAGRAVRVRIEGKPYIVIDGKEPTISQRSGGCVFYSGDKLIYAFRGGVEREVILDKKPKVVANPVVQQVGGVKEQVKNAVEKPDEKKDKEENPEARHARFEQAIHTLLKGTPPSHNLDPVESIPPDMRFPLIKDEKNPASIEIRPFRIDKHPVFERVAPDAENAEYRIEKIRFSYDIVARVYVSSLAPEPISVHQLLPLLQGTDILDMHAKVSYRYAGFPKNIAEVPISVALVPHVARMEKGANGGLVPGNITETTLRVIAKGTTNQIPKVNNQDQVFEGTITVTVEVECDRVVRRSSAEDADPQKIDPIKQAAADAAKTVKINQTNKQLTEQERREWMVEMIKDPKYVWADGVLLGNSGTPIHTGPFLWKEGEGVALHMPGGPITTDRSKILIFSMGATPYRLQEVDPVIVKWRGGSVMDTAEMPATFTPNKGVHGQKKSLLSVKMNPPKIMRIYDPVVDSHLAELQTNDHKEMGILFARHVLHRQAQAKQKPAVIAGNVAAALDKQQAEEQPKK